MALMRDIVGHTLAGYRIESLIGLGSMGAVYRAIHVDSGEEVAIKTLPSALAENSDHLKRFQREAETVAMLKHPYIIPIYAYGSEDGMGYIVMKLLTGQTLSNWISTHQNTPTPLDQVADIVESLAVAFDFAHESGVIHRDVKPANVMFDDSGHLFLVDFGIAKVAHATSALTGTGTVIGTPHYMAPEQWLGHKAVPATDQYALAAMAYQLCTGKLPYDTESPLALIHMHMHERPKPAHEVREDLPFALSKVLSVAMSKDPGYRFESVTAFGEAFADVIRHGFVSSPLPSTPLTRELDEAELNDDHMDGATEILLIRELDNQPIAESRPQLKKWTWIAAALVLGVVAIFIMMTVLGGDKDGAANGEDQQQAVVASETVSPTATLTLEPSPTNTSEPSPTPSSEPTATTPPTEPPSEAAVVEPSNTPQPSATMVETATIYERVVMENGLEVFENPNNSTRLFAVAVRTGFAPFVAGQYMDDEAKLWLYLYYYDAGELDDGWSRADSLTLDEDEIAALDRVDPENPPAFPEELAYHDVAERPYGSGVVAATNVPSNGNTGGGTSGTSDTEILSPSLNVSAACDHEVIAGWRVVYTVTNNGGAMTDAAPYSLSWPLGSDSGNLMLGAGQNTTLSTGRSALGGNYNLTITMPTGPIDAPASC